MGFTLKILEDDKISISSGNNTIILSPYEQKELSKWITELCERKERVQNWIKEQIKQNNLPEKADKNIEYLNTIIELLDIWNESSHSDEEWRYSFEKILETIIEDYHLNEKILYPDFIKYLDYEQINIDKICSEIEIKDDKEHGCYFNSLTYPNIRALYKDAKENGSNLFFYNNNGEVGLKYPDMQFFIPEMKKMLQGQVAKNHIKLNLRLLKEQGQPYDYASALNMDLDLYMKVFNELTHQKAKIGIIVHLGTEVNKMLSEDTNVYLHKTVKGMELLENTTKKDNKIYDYWDYKLEVDTYNITQLFKEEWNKTFGLNKLNNHLKVEILGVKDDNDQTLWTIMIKDLYQNCFNLALDSSNVQKLNDCVEAELKSKAFDEKEWDIE